MIKTAEKFMATLSMSFLAILGVEVGYFPLNIVFPSLAEGA
jgi:hypothetical protein